MNKKNLLSILSIVLCGLSVQAMEKVDCSQLHFDEGIPPLHAAALKGDLRSFQKLIDGGADLKVVYNGISVLHNAAQGSNSEIVQLLFERGRDVIDVNETDGFGNTPLMLAVRSAKLPNVVQMLLKYGADVKKKNRKNRDALYYALKLRKLRLIDLFMSDASNDQLSLVVENNLRDWYIHDSRAAQRQRLFLEACRFGCSKIATYLLSEKLVDTRKIDYSGDLPLHVAATWGHSDIVGLLIDQKAQATIFHNGNSALHCAVTGQREFISSDGEICQDECAYPGVVEILLTSGAIVDARDHFDSTALYYACSKNDVVTVKILLNAKANVVDCGKFYSNSPLNVAAQNESPAVLECLLETKVNVDVLDSNGDTPLMYAVKKKRLPNITLLLKHGAHIDSTHGPMGRTPLFEAVFSGSANVAGYLIDSGAAVNRQDSKGMTPLHLGCGSNMDMLELLLNKKASVDMVDYKGFAPLHMAVVEKIKNNDVGYYISYEENNDGMGFVKTYISLGDEESGFFQPSGCEEDSYGTCLIVERLIRAGAQVNIATKKGWTPLLLAALVHRKAIMDILIGSGARLNGITKEGWSLLHVAMLNVENVEAVLDYLLNSWRNCYLCWIIT